MELIIDTTVLIDLWRCNKRPQRLSDLKEKAGKASLVMPWITEAEFTRGAVHLGLKRSQIELFYKDFVKCGLSAEAIWRYAQVWTDLARLGKVSDYPDLWVAVSALERGCPVITRNVRHFDKIPELAVVGYDLSQG